MVHIYLITLLVMIWVTALVFGTILLINHLKWKQVNDMQKWVEEVAVAKIYDELENRMDGLMEKTYDLTMKFTKRMTDDLMKE